MKQEVLNRIKQWKRSRLNTTVLVVVVLALTATAVSAATYTVQAGDTLFRIAQRFGTTVDAIVAANNIPNRNLIHPNQQLEIPGTEPSSDGNDDTSTPAPSNSTASTYTVKRGDTLFGIARQFNTTVLALVQANNIFNPNYIQPGQVLQIPGGTGDSTGTDTDPATDPATDPNPNPPSSNFAGELELGGQTQSFANADTMVDAGMTWVKIQYKWKPGDSPDAVINHIEDAQDYGFNILLSITGADTYPSPGSIDFAGFVNFLREVAAFSPDAIEIWNEMNIDFEWPAGEISPNSYVNDMLAPAYNAIKTANADVMVISGAPAPTGFDNGHNAWADDRYIRGMAAAGAANYMDCVGVHHNAGATSPYDTTGHPAGSHYSWYFQPTMEVYYNAFGGSRPLCFTEIGYLSGSGFNRLPDNFSWASNTSVDDHAVWLGEAVEVASDSNKVRLFIVFNVDFTQYDENGDPQAGYAIIRPDGSCPACEELYFALDD